MTTRVKPRAGIILAGIPSKGADVEDKLAKEWLEAGLAVLVDEPKPKPSKPVIPAKEG